MATPINSDTPKGGKISGELYRVEHEFFRTMSTMIISAFGLVAALAWNTAITKIMEEYLVLDPTSSMWSWLIYAIAVTLITVLATIYVGRLSQRLDQTDKPKQSKKE